MFETAKSFFGGSGSQLAILENSGRTVMPHAVERKQIERKILKVFAKSRRRAEDSLMSREMPEAGFELTFRVVHPAVPAVTRIA
jgi:hypothetical protein